MSRRDTPKVLILDHPLDFADWGEGPPVRNAADAPENLQDRIAAEFARAEARATGNRRRVGMATASGARRDPVGIGRDATARELKLIQYLNEAYGKEKQLETTLQAQIKLFTPKPTIKKRLQEHHKETKQQSRGLEKRIKALGGKATTSDLPGPDITDNAAGVVANVANKALAAAKGPVQALRGTSASDNLLRNARDAFWNEAEEIAHYNVIEAAADQLGDKETVKMAREFRRQEERMQKFIEKQTPALVKDVIKEEVPKAERQPAGASSRSASSRSTSRSSSSRSSSSRAKSSGTKSSGAKRSTAAKSSGTKSTRSTAAKSSGTRSTAAKSSGARSTAAKSSASHSDAAKSSGSSNVRSSSPRSRIPEKS